MVRLFLIRLSEFFWYSLLGVGYILVLVQVYRQSQPHLLQILLGWLVATFFWVGVMGLVALLYDLHQQLRLFNRRLLGEGSRKY